MANHCKMRIIATILAASPFILQSTGCSLPGDQGTAGIGIASFALSAGQVHSLTVYALSTPKGGCLDLYLGKVDPLSPSAGLSAMKTVELTATSTTVHLGSIPVGKRAFFVEAYASSDGTGGILGAGCALGNVEKNKTVKVIIDSVCPRNASGQCE
ncbi:MAG: hypothetical protein GXP49_17430 [Deltaproteobacteria bacterium]|nr:hypothetical protein [Deltaproteobacteria bacterium]